jgi:hypothetical protein
MTGHDDYILHVELFDDIGVLEGRLYEFYPRAKTIAKERIIAQYRIASVVFLVSALKHLG